MCYQRKTTHKDATTQNHHLSVPVKLMSFFFTPFETVSWFLHGVMELKHGQIHMVQIPQCGSLLHELAKML